MFSGTADCVRKTYRLGGFSGLYQGMTVTTLREVPAFSFYFTSHKYFENHLNSLNFFNPYASSFIAGGGAGAVSWAVCYPLDIAKTEVQMAKYTASKEDKSFVQVLRRMRREHGIRYLYRGLGATVLRSFPVNAVLFPVYKFCTEFLNSNFDIKAGEN